jgi:hypothetical protein
VIVDGLIQFKLHDEQWETIDQDDITLSQLSLFKFPEMADLFWPALSRLFQLPWFFRAWVIQ